MHAREARAGACIPGFDYGVFTNGKMSLENFASSDSFNSAVGAYAAGGCGGNLGTNSTSSGAAALQNNAHPCGTITTGAGGTVTAVGNSSFTGPSLALSSPVTLSTVTAPVLPAGGAATFGDNATHVLAPGFSYTSMSCSGPNTVISLSAGNYVVTGDIILNQCKIKVTSGLAVVYFKALFDVSNFATINAPTTSGLPTNLVFMGKTSSTNVIHFYNTVKVYAGIYAPSAAEFHIEQFSEVFGAVVAKSYHGENHGDIHYDQAMASLAGGPFACAGEVSRATPIVATVGGTSAVVQGTFKTPPTSRTTITDTASIATFSYPYLEGHMRARAVSSITTAETAFSAGTILFDAGASGKIPARVNAGCASFTGTCRNVFTNTNSVPSDGRTFHPTQVQLKDSNASAIGALIAPASVVTGITAANWQTIVRKVVSGGLGGVDRSTVAVIGPSAVAGTTTRPTIAYFGATDGMIHAVCASTGGTTATVASPGTVCPSLGTELWAFLPGTQLPLVRNNAARIDGSVRVLDAFGDFTNDPATGKKSWHTILTFQTGSSIGSRPGAYALDVTDPASPIILWEVTTPTAPAAQDFGTGLVMAAGRATINGTPTNVVVAQTSNGGTGGAGIVATALQLETGTEQWQFSYAYPETPRGGLLNLPYPTTGIPGGATGVDLVGTGDVTDFVFGDLYGDVWRVDAATGVSTTGATTPLFSFTTDKHPIGVPAAVFSASGSLYAAFASGGYDDPTATSWSTPSQFLIAVKLKPTGTSFPLAETATKCTTCDLMLATPLAASKGFSQALIVGNQLFVTTDTTDVNFSTFGTTSANTGSLMTVNLANSTSTTVVISGGASSLASSGTTLISSTSDQQSKLATSATSTTGTSVDSVAVAKITRALWLRSK